MKISELIRNLDDVQVFGEDLNIKQLAFNTKDITEGALFFCIEGVKVDGHSFAQNAIDGGAAALVVSKDVDVSGKPAIIKVADTRKAMAIISANFYNNPSADIEIIGITGTNGKTTSTFMLKAILDNSCYTTGLLGTIYNISGKHVEEAKRTTPESMDLQHLFYKMKSDGVNACIMEVSSHSLELSRVHGVKFKAGIFTNLTQDHLDYHGTMENYFSAKLKLFNNCEFAVINIDDEYGKRAFDLIKNKKLTFGIDNIGNCDVYGENTLVTEAGSSFDLCIKGEKHHVQLNMPGKFNIYNALGCAAAAYGMGIPVAKIAEGLMKLQNVPGRSEKLTTPKGVTLVIDYAHSPDGIENILKTAREYTKGKLYILFGCGGDRDRTKRSIMGRAAGRLSDFCIVTSDNPRSEDPDAIIKDIIPGVEETKCPYIVISDRTEAIEFALKTAVAGDVVIIAGKGHETYQVLKDKTIHFDEREIIARFLGEENA